MAKLRHGEGTVSPYTLADGTTRYRARWREDGRLQSRSFADEQSARTFLIELSGDRRIGRHTPVSVMTVKQAVESYLRRNADRWSTNTLASYRQVAKSHIYPHIGNERIAGLKTSRVQSWVDLLNRRGLAASTVHNAHIIIRGTCGDLVRMDELPRNPANDIRLPTRKRTRRETWNEAQVADVIRHAAEMYPYMAVMYRVAITTGMRPGEIRALKWQDIDFDAGTITCERTVTRDERFRQRVGTSTKTSRVRTIAVPASTITALREHRTRQLERRLSTTGWIDTDLVFERGNGQMVAQESMRKHHEKVCKAAGVPVIRMHDLRHSAATILLRRGIPAKVVSEILGHANIGTTLDIYSHVDVSMQRSATDILGEIAK